MATMTHLVVLTLMLLLPLAPAAQAGAEGEGAPRAGSARPASAGPPPSAPMVAVPGGSYTPLYSPESGSVRVESFRMDRYPVTRGDFAAFVATNPRWRRSEVRPVFAAGRYLSDWRSDLDPGGRRDSPVTDVSWFAARAYCAWMGSRLPRVDEWEYASRADETRLDAMGDAAHKARILQLYTRRSRPLAPVGSTFRNAHGIHDLHGLAWEWVLDFNTVTAADDSRGGDRRDSQLYCAAGADGATDREDYAAFLRYAFRSTLQGASTSGVLGFRCAADL
jgi:formylglycine-generating enzyme